MNSTDWKNIGKKIAQAAPVIGGLLAGPYGAAVAAAGALASAVLGVENTPEAVAEAIKSDPDALVKLKQAEMDHSTQLQRLALEKEQMIFRDRADARDRDIQIRKTATDHDNARSNWMIAGDVIGLIVCMVVLYLLRDASGEGLGEMRGLITAIAGYFGLGLRDAHQFEFGSSRGSKDKTAALSASIVGNK